MSKEYNRTKIKSTELEKRATALRLTGLTYREISAQLGVSHVSCYRAVLRSIDRNRKQTAENVDVLRNIEQARLERLIAAADAKAQDGDIAAIDVVRKLSESLRKLNGLDAPAKTDVTSGGDKIAWIDFIMGEKEDDGITKPSGQ